MLVGKLFYDEIDVARNKVYIEWLIAEALSQGIKLELSIVGKDRLRKCDFVINRSRNYELALTYELNGIRVFNNSKFTLVGNNKLAGYHFIDEIGIHHAKIYLEDENNELPSKLIRKPNFGHGGQDISLVDANRVPLDKRIDFIYQEYIHDNIGDVRYYVINDQVVHSVIRIPQKDQIISNFTKGGNIEVYFPSKKEMEVIDKVLSNIHIDFGGIDFIVSKTGEFLFNEFEDVVGSRMLSHLGINDTTNLYIKHIQKSL
jgi:glutathione synthase/RimK-type ligase-like ATP-grasp enzyme